MKNRIKRMTALLLAMVMCLSLLSTGVWATESSQTTDEPADAQSSEEMLAETADASIIQSIEADTSVETPSIHESVNDPQTTEPEEAVAKQAALDTISSEERDTLDEGIDAADAQTDRADEDRAENSSQTEVDEDRGRSGENVAPQSSDQLLTSMAGIEIGKVHNLVICGSKDAQDGYSSMRQVLKNNTLPFWRNDGKVVTLAFEEGDDKGITKDQLFAKFEEAFGESEDNDLNILYYGGHTELIDNKNPETAAMAIHLVKGGLRYIYTGFNYSCDRGVPVEELFQELDKYPGQYIVILDTCYANAYNKYGLQKLKKENQTRYEMMMSFSENAQTFKALWKDMGCFTKHTLNGIGYSNDYTEMDADHDGDGAVTIAELQAYLSTKTKGFLWNPHYHGYNSDIPLFQFAKTKIVDEKKIEKEWCVGEKIQLSAKIKRGGDRAREIQWKSSYPDVAFVSSSGEVTFCSAGKVTISSYLEDDNGNQYLGSESELTFTVKKPSITLSSNSLKLYKTETKPLTATVKGTTKAVKWISSDKSVATVDSKGKVTGKKAGVCVISAYIGDTDANCVVNIKEPTIKLNKSTLSLDVKKTATLKATVNGPSKNVKWKSSNTKIATVDKNGKVKAKKAGSCTITATTNGVSAKCKVTVLSEKEKAIEVYKKFLSQDNITWSGASYTSTDFNFALVYIDNNSVPELILSKSNSTHPEGYIAIYTYKSDKIVLLDQSRIIDFSYYPKKGVYIAYYQENGWGYQIYNTFSSGKAKKWLQYSRGYNMSSQKWVEEYRKFNAKKSSKIMKSAFEKSIKKKVGDVKKKKVNDHKNTASNRKKYLK